MTLSRTLSANPGGWSSVDDVQLTGTPTWTLTHCDADVRLDIRQSATDLRSTRRACLGIVLLYNA